VSIRILLADDERLVRAGFRMILKAEPDLEVVGEAADGHEAVEAETRLRPDVVLMDIRMPTLDGLEATRRILAGPDPRPRVIVLTTFDLDAYVYEALHVGASGFLLKDAPEDHLVAAIRIAADGGSIFAPSVTRRLIEEFTRRAKGGATRARGPHGARARGAPPHRRTRRRRMSRTFSRSSICAIACRPLSSPTRRNSSSPARRSLASRRPPESSCDSSMCAAPDLHVGLDRYKTGTSARARAGMRVPSPTRSKGRSEEGGGDVPAE
jgi:DNA-binding NarL/FixJ family response regulator